MHTQTREPALLLRAEEVASLLNLGRTTIFGMIGRGELKAIHVGRSVRIARVEVDRWLKDQGAAIDNPTESAGPGAA